MLRNTLITMLGMTLAIAGSTAQADSITLRQGLNGYAGTTDLFIDANGPSGSSTDMEYNGRRVVDVWGNTVASPYDTTVKHTQGLLKFDLSSVPAGATITSATLTFYIHNPFEALHLYRMTTAWDESTVSWDTFGSGAPAEGGGINPGVETESTADFSSNTQINSGLFDIDVTATVQAWLNGTANNGWAFMQQNANRGMFVSSEDTVNTADRPTLTIEYTAIPEPAALGMLSLLAVATLRRR